MLNNTQIKNLKPAAKLYRKTDSNGLMLEVKPSGVKVWRYRFRFDGKPTMMSLGEYPAVSLAQARQLRDDARALLVDGINPVQHRRADDEVLVVVTTFGELYSEWYAHNLESWTEGYADDLDKRCSNHLLPWLDNRPVNDITAMEMLEVFKRIEARGTLNMLKKVKGYASRVFRYGVGMGRCERDPTRDLPDDIFKKEKPRSYATVTKPDEVASVLRAIGDYSGYPQVRIALLIAPQVALRPSELAGLKWSEVDFEQGWLEIDADRMKMKRPHLVPMSRQVRDLLKEAESLKIKSEYVFESPRSFTRPINAETLRAALRRCGIAAKELTTHGFRHMATTLLNEKGWHPDAIERQLAHVDKNKVRGTYNKAEYLSIRREMMQWWSDYLDELLAK